MVHFDNHTVPVQERLKQNTIGRGNTAYVLPTANMSRCLTATNA